MHKILRCRLQSRLTSLKHPDRFSFLSFNNKKNKAIPSEKLDLKPIRSDQRPIAERKEGAEIRAAPEEVRGNTPSGNLGTIRIEEAEVFFPKRTLPFINGRSAIAFSDPI